MDGETVVAFANYLGAMELKCINDICFCSISLILDAYLFFYIPKMSSYINETEVDSGYAIMPFLSILQIYGKRF